MMMQRAPDIASGELETNPSPLPLESLVTLRINQELPVIEPAILLGSPRA
jgi:hypothetical protein